MIFKKFLNILNSGSSSNPTSNNLSSRGSSNSKHDVYTDPVHIATSSRGPLVFPTPSFTKRNSHSDFRDINAPLSISKRNFSAGNALHTIDTPSLQSNKPLGSVTSDLNEAYSETSSHEFNKIDISDFDLHHDHNIRQVFRHMNHFSSILQQLNAMRVHEQMCDVTLVLDGDMIMCHKYVLGANSPYFLALFTNGLMETE